MRIAFIWPHANTVYQTIPISVAVLHTNIRDLGHTTRMFNLPLEGWTASSPEYKRAIGAFQPELICISAWAVSFKSVVAAIQEAKKLVPNAKVILGGNYPTLNPEQAFAPGLFDYMILGEAELAFREFVRAFAAGDREAIARIPGIYFRNEAGEIVRNRSTFVENLDLLGAPDYDFIELGRCLDRGYLSTLMGPRRKVAMFATRGCEYSCNFCTAPIMNGQALRHYSVEFVTREIRKVYDRFGVRMICFMDDNGTQDREFFKSLCRAIAAMGLKDLELDLYRGLRLENLDEEMLHLMKAAGFQLATIAPESGSERVRKLMRKDLEDADIRRSVKMIKNAGLSVQGYFIIGYPGETAEERRESYRYIDELGLDIFSLHKYMALPGTAMFLKLVKQGKITRDHTDDSHLIGEPLPNFNGDLPAEIDREILQTYAWFYLRKPWKIVHLLHEASAGGLWRSVAGTAKAAALSLVGLNDPNAPLPAVREQM